LQKKSTAIAEDKNTTMKNITNQLRLIEDQTRYATQIKIVQGKLRSGSVTRVTYIDENGMIHESTDREHPEELCNNANEAKLQQTADTPLSTGALQEDVGWLGICPSGYMMLDGIYEPPPQRKRMSIPRS
jgi:hypothetical protein